MKNFLTIRPAVLLGSLFVAMALGACGEHSGYTVTEFTGDYRYSSGIAEFFNCQDKTKYYVAKAGISKELIEQYQSLSLKDNHDAYLKVTGYLKEEKQMDGVAPITVFVPVEFIAFDKSRGCEPGIRKGH